MSSAPLKLQESLDVMCILQLKATRVASVGSDSAFDTQSSFSSCCVSLGDCPGEEAVVLLSDASDCTALAGARALAYRCPVVILRGFSQECKYYFELA